MKATHATIAQRVEEVLRLRLLGAEFSDIREYARGDETADPPRQPWNVSDSQLWRYIQKSDKLLALHTEKDRDRLFNRHLAQRRALYARCMEAGDWRAALAVVKDEAELQGLYPATNLHVQESVQLQITEIIVDTPEQARENLLAPNANGLSR